MAKLVAILNVVAWAGFWAFGYLALTSDPDETRLTMIATLLAASSGALGLFAWFRLVRHSEEAGLVRPRKRAPIIEQDDPEND
jgi:ammonia channel protein AmtB